MAKSVDHEKPHTALKMPFYITYSYYMPNVETVYIHIVSVQLCFALFHFVKIIIFLSIQHIYLLISSHGRFTGTGAIIWWHHN